MIRRRLHPAPCAVALVLLALAVAPSAARAAGQLFLYAENQLYGQIRGDAVAQGFEDWIVCQAFQHAISVPVGPGGVPTGAPQTTPLTIQAYFDPSTVRFLASQAVLEPFTSLQLDWADDLTGDTLLRFDLNDAYLASVSESASSGDARPLVTLVFSYDAIAIQDYVEGTSAVFDWNPTSSSALENLAKGLLLSPSPNPTQGPAEFRFSLPADSNAVLALYDLRGHRVRELHNGFTPAGGGVVAWDGTDDHGRRVGQGVYLARLTSPGREVTERLTVLR